MKYNCQNNKEIIKMTNKYSDFYLNQQVTHSYDLDRMKKMRSLIAIEYTYKNILDVGCGDGALIRNFFSDGVMYGVDISDVAVGNALNRGIIAKKITIDSEKLPFEDGFFDLIIMGEVIEHLINPDFTIREIRRVLKEGGVLLLSTPNLASWYNRFLLLFGFQPIFTEVSTEGIFGRPGSQPVGHLRIYTLKALIAFLRYHGFKVVNQKGTTFKSLPYISRCADEIFTLAPQLSSGLIIKAIK